ncbi:MAG: hypothetical protein EHM61_20950 [Acidobacteria bacterium]|nr:MAG: hypothetical protein EHM61_20950 [Acidobacteriota bacterium]
MGISAEVFLARLTGWSILYSKRSPTSLPVAFCSIPACCSAIKSLIDVANGAAAPLGTPPNTPPTTPPGTPPTIPPGTP